MTYAAFTEGGNQFSQAIKSLRRQAIQTQRRHVDTINGIQDRLEAQIDRNNQVQQRLEKAIARHLVCWQGIASRHHWHPPLI